MAEMMYAKAQEEGRIRAEKWTETTYWTPWLHIDAASYDPPRLFGLPCAPRMEGSIRAEKIPLGCFIDSPDGVWRYANLTLPKGTMLSTYRSLGRRGEVNGGKVVFNGDVVIPALWEKQPDGAWSETPWMSLTPAEILSQREGVDEAHDSVLVVGLGIGWLLSEVLRKKSVTNVILIEKSKSLADWLLPRILSKLQPQEWAKLADVVIGDAFECIRGLRADVGLVDIWMDYCGDNRKEFGRLKQRSGRNNGAPNVIRWWGWVP